jgi:hypothetical protein
MCCCISFKTFLRGVILVCLVSFISIYAVVTHITDERAAAGTTMGYAQQLWQSFSSNAAPLATILAQMVAYTAPSKLAWFGFALGLVTLALVVADWLLGLVC